MYSGCRLTSSQEQCGIDCEFNVEFKGFNVDDEVTKLHHLKSITSESYIMACYASTLEKMKFIGKEYTYCDFFLYFSLYFIIVHPNLDLVNLYLVNT